MKNQKEYTELVRGHGEKTLQLFVTVGDEQYRIVNGAFMYLFTEGKYNVENYMVDSLLSVENNFNAKFGKYPIIIYYGVSEETRQRVMDKVKPKSRVYWIPVNQLHSVRLPDLPVFANKTLEKGIGECANLQWDPSYLLMVRFRSVSIPLKR